MASFVYNNAKTQLMNGGLDLDTHDIRIALLMTNTTADTENDGITTISGFTTLDEMDGANYARAALAGEAVATDDANDRAEFDANDVTFSALGAGTRAVAGILVYRHITNDTDSVPIAWIDGTGFPYTASGADLVIQWDAEGILQLA